MQMEIGGNLAMVIAVAILGFVVVCWLALGRPGSGAGDDGDD